MKAGEPKSHIDMIGLEGLWNNFQIIFIFLVDKNIFTDNLSPFRDLFRWLLPVTKTSLPVSINFRLTIDKVIDIQVLLLILWGSVFYFLSESNNLLHNLR